MDMDRHLCIGSQATLEKNGDTIELVPFPLVVTIDVLVREELGRGLKYRRQFAKSVRTQRCSGFCTLYYSISKNRSLGFGLCRTPGKVYFCDHTTLGEPVLRNLL